MFPKKRLCQVFFRNDHIRQIRLPIDTEAGVVKPQAAFVAGGVKIIAFISDKGRFAEHEVAVGKSPGYEQLPVVAIVEAFAVPFSESRFFFAQVDHHVQDLSFDYPDQFGLFERQCLVMEASQRSFFGKDLDILYENGVDACSFELALVKTLKQVSPFIFKDPWFKYFQVPERGIKKRHDLWYL